MLEILFTSGIIADIMSLLFNNPEEKCYVREIAILINKNPSGVKQEVYKFYKMNLVLTEREGNLKYFRVNRNSPLFPELKGLIAKSLGLPGALKSVLKASEAKTAFIYGPYIQNADIQSLDLFVVTDSNHIKKSLGDIEKRFGRKIKLTLMGISDYREMKKKGNRQFKKLINSRKIVLLGRL